MLREITLGQYYPAKSILHSLDPRVKLFSTLVFIITLFSVDNVVLFAIVLLTLIGIIKMSHVPFSFMVKGLRSIVVLLIIAGLFNLFLTPGITIFSFGFLKISDVGLKNAVLMTSRMILLIIGTSVMTLTTTPNQLTDGLEKSLGFLKKFNVPVHEISMMMSIALRFIPILIEETDKIMKAQMARGADFETGGLIKKAKNMVPLLVPLFVSAFRRANDLSYAMEARCYNGGEGRTKMRPLKYSSLDQRAYICIVAYIIIFYAVKVVL
ncbi:energy-coupling factor transporter transmembrane component T family protein [Pseudobutyrivibrio sp.]|uniref:energy-coupling factor transporter transmembrane component T family protein n=1 Tax=Pseudobutyrivibrio sp. TaxID=2014367 RepID=UPI0025DB6BC5|nr:energy-coupling factor transporter transmembrane component T [Pseudobutyrivibrio sp.]MBQ8488790.1 energy-coupling factor transporter transmembrane protein EcfT [Pseudobutyrivibrio sp.]